ncbi:phosphoribosyltransferase [Lentzea tibetensis]|uniref:Phosphoribosyltransferase n=1 Tax=Lentzea tibetensis TaxID=2591470 RepID=A0A563EZ14_9PSEU|nr:phosphoribosyltransferase [Lentzea tibetensis]TWP52909.1 phosphoribosyltransferase [Lentzea tibetensis]
MSPFSQLIERYSNILVPPPPVVAGVVCEVCRRDSKGWTRCWQCNKHYEAANSELADLVVPISIAVKDQQLAYVLAKYKYSRFQAVRTRFTNELLSVLANFLGRHGECLGPFELVTVVPSTRERTNAHPLVDLLGRRLGFTRGRFAEVLSTTEQNTRQLRPDACTVHSDVADKNVLLVDDTWTSGASLQSCAVALKRAGAKRVVGLVIGRHLDPTDEHTTQYLDLVRSRPFDWNSCCACFVG